MELGRLDGLSSTAASVGGKLPHPTDDVNQLTSLFAKNGLSLNDMIALSGKNIYLLHDQEYNHTVQSNLASSDLKN